MKIEIGFKAFDPHELLCHFVAVDAGLYREDGIEVDLVDITFMDDLQLPETLCQVSCGAALAAALRGSPQRVLLVGCDRPMFWIFGRDAVERPEQLAGKRLATYPAIAPPHHLANLLLKKHGVDHEQGLKLHPARDDLARLGLLKSRHVEAAVISSAISPITVRGMGFNSLGCIGDELRVPTTGLAARQAYLEREPALFAALTRIYRRALGIIRNQPLTVAQVLEKVFLVANEDAASTAALYTHCYTEAGRTTPVIAGNAVAALCQSLGIESVPDWKEIYRLPE